jgi:hypothetical protein
MYGRQEGRHSRAAQTAEAELRRGLEQLANAGLLRIAVDEAMAVTTAMAIGCVTQLIDGGGSATGPVARSMRAALSLEHLGDNIGATEVAAQLTDEEVRALTAVEDEESATLSKMPAQMVDALRRRRRGSAGRP